ncbi:MAG: DUF4174 domain-containing protein, partial [Arenibacter sp.]|nr:DUF4174 domain-containing protein [Arenibacter sp.]
RVILIVSQNEDSKTYNQQIAQLSRLPKALKERKILVYEILPERYRIMNYLNKEKKSKWISSSLLYGQYGNKQEVFKVILIGLDGGVKLNSSNVLIPSELFATIDSMPMRRAEMENKRD